MIAQAARPLLSLLSALGAALLVAAPAAAGPPGTWTQVTSEPQPSNTREIGLERTADGVLHLVWTRDNGASEQVLHSSIPLSGSEVVGPDQLVSTTSALNPSVDLIAGPGGGLRAFFSGLFPGSPLPGGYDTVMASATAPAAGTPWSAPAAASNNQLGTSSPVYVGSGIGAALVAGQPISTWGTPRRRAAASTSASTRSTPTCSTRRVAASATPTSASTRSAATRCWG